MTTNRDIVYERLWDTLIHCSVRGLLTDEERAFLKDDIEAFIETIQEHHATKEQIEWNIQEKI